ncbi:hypothetical protein L210DRAFT_3403684 [Boletus edulis BED1]|uniref:Uncharacterized protein n=1 Tax=Boletus edulis BED1 TaxID=1328754 RepID=A0AAD4BT72_BOLED|nr:hypothetical protein L210DRAFT_3403684 [Boletus edulis BED1]
MLRVYCDASPFGLRFWLPSSCKGFQSPATHLFSQHDKSIFYLEALCVCAAILHVINLVPAGGRLAVFMDNLNSVQMFNSFAALPAFNWMLIAVADAVIERDIDFRVLHVPGTHNIIADLLSRFRNSDALQLEPRLTIHSFQPPQPVRAAWSMERLLVECSINLGLALDTST